MAMNDTIRKNRGFTLIETMVVLVIAMLMMAGIAAAADYYFDGIANQAAAQHAKKVSKASQAYIRDHYTALVAGAGPATPVTVTPATLLAGGYLPAGFSARNSYGQTFEIQVIEPSTGKLESIVLTAGGDTIDGQNLRRIAKLIGVEGGYVESTGASAAAKGAFGGWTRSLAAFGGSNGVGKLAVALFVSQAAGQDDYLHRSATAGQPQLNTMATDIDMDGNNIAAAGTVYAMELRAGQTRIYEDISGNTQLHSNGDVYFINSGAGHLNNVHGENFTAGGTIKATGSIFTHQELHSGGNITADGSIFTETFLRGDDVYAKNWFRTEGNGGWYSNAHGGGWYMADNMYLRTYGGKDILTQGGIWANDLINAYGDDGLSVRTTMRSGSIKNYGELESNGKVIAFDGIIAGDRIRTDEFLWPLGTAVCEASCPDNGLIGRTTAGQLMSCVSGTWKCLAFATGGGTGGGPGPTPSGCPGTYPPPSNCPAGFHGISNGCQRSTSPFDTINCP